MSKSPEEATAKSSSCNSSPINVEDDRRHYVASPLATEFNKSDDNNASDNVADNVKDNSNGNDQEEQPIPVSDDEETCEDTQQQQQDQTYDSFGQQIETHPNDSFNEIDDISIAGEINDYLLKNNVNFAEFNTVVDMWGFCDAISAQHGGLPDSLLKDAFCIVLEGFLNHAQNNSWQRQHLDNMLRMWKVEMLKSKSTPRPTKFVAAPFSDTIGTEKQNLDRESTLEKQEEPKDQTATPEQSQASEEAIKTAKRQKREMQRRKRKLAAIMGVGQVLSSARRKMATEDAEVEVKEDEFGNFSIGGMPLSFESWGQLNRVKDNDIVHVGIEPSPKSNSVSPSHPNGFVSSQKQQRGLSMAEKYPTVSEVEMPSNDIQPTTASRIPSTVPGTSASKEVKDLTPVKSPIPPPPKEKDEGELSSTEPSDKPTSSEESSDDESQQKSFTFKRNAALLKKNIESRPSQRPPQQQERKRIKKDERQQGGQQGASSAQNLQQLLQKCFDLRGRIVRKLSIQQKAMFMDLLKQSMAGTLQQGVQNLQQQQAMALLMNTINASGIGSSSS
uniref:Uncharacterized protein n=1 Tax=Meloidogyne enterolobii TaxID=390850 RepID=A0A6V7UJ19_MELEN|nr:unnamed protein product [Meloidogyne enterolobii]